MSLLSYDLLDGALPENPTFKVQFRHYRVIRPHFMIHAHKKNGAAYNGMNVEHPEHLVSAAISMVKEYKTELENDTILTLSIHTDDFASNIEEFHGQLCVEVATYLNVFHKLKCKLPKDVNIETYEKDVEKWSKRKSYVADDVDIIIKREDPNGPAQITEEDRIRTTRKLKEKNVFVFYHKKYPMIGFFTKANREKEDQFVSKHIKILMDYKDEYLKNYPKQPEEKRGYHLCFRPEGYFPDKEDYSKNAWNGQTDELNNLKLVAYILTTGYHFYQICPHEYREAWFKDYQKSKFIPMT